MSLRALVFRNFGTKLLSLGIACATWWIVSGDRRERISERSYRIPLSIVNVPSGTMVVSPLPDAVDVRVRGPFTPLRQLDPTKLDAVLDLIDAHPGERRFTLGPEDINVPRNVEVISISPPEVRLLLDTVAEKQVPILPDLTGHPADGWIFEEAVPEPHVARISGPAGTLAHTMAVRTEPVSIQNREGSFSVPTTLAAQAPGIRVREAQIVTVRVRMRALPTPTPTVKPRRK
ncbi:MAG TPA: CdaR family protein [Verrucomicrobiae bacterium]|nr:CdaR family protein [Verrucomicrobiae bacterium]